MSRATQYLAYMNGNYQPVQINHYFTDLEITESIKEKRKEYRKELSERMANYKLEKLQNGETFITKEFGYSMMPLLKSGQPHKLEPATLETVEVNDIVFCKVKGFYYTHLVKGKCPKRGALIGNNKGRINGWTKQIFGKVIEKY